MYKIDINILKTDIREVKCNKRLFNSGNRIKKKQKKLFTI